MILFTTLFCGFFVGIPTFLFPTSQKLLRNIWNYYALIGMAIAIIVITVISFDEFVTEKKEELAFIALSPLTFLIIHKLVDNFWQKKYNRHIYFYQKYSQDYESQESTWIEFFVQFLIFIVPFLWIAVGNYIFKYCR